MSTGTAAQKYAELRNKIADAKKVMEDTAKGLFTEMSTDLFAENPTLMSFGWTQYTPYFNDGEECVFRCNGRYPTVSIMVDGDLMGYDSNRGELEINSKEARSHEYYERVFKGMKGSGISAIVEGNKTVNYDGTTNTVTIDGVKVKTYDEYHKMFKPLEKIVAEFMDAFEDEDMKVMFGDHVQVVVKRDGEIDVEEYSHD